MKKKARKESPLADWIERAEVRASLVLTCAAALRREGDHNHSRLLAPLAAATLDELNVLRRSLGLPQRVPTKAQRREMDAVIGKDI